MINSSHRKKIFLENESLYYFLWQFSISFSSLQYLMSSARDKNAEAKSVINKLTCVTSFSYRIAPSLSSEGDVQKKFASNLVENQ
jgi:hypothetical protein